MDREPLAVKARGTVARWWPAPLILTAIVLSNWALLHVGWGATDGPRVIPVAPGLVAPSGALVAGLTFTLRDSLQEHVGQRAAVVVIAAGAVLSGALSPQLGFASGVTFAASELCDLAVFTRLRSRGWLTAVTGSNVVSSLTDSALFLLLAFGSSPVSLVLGATVAKFEVSWLLMALLMFLRRARQRSRSCSLSTPNSRRA